MYLMHKEQLNPWPTLSAYHVVICSWLSACPGKIESFIDHLGAYVFKVHKQSSLDDFQYQYLPECVYVSFYQI